MAKIEGFRIKNFKTLKNIVMGKLMNEQGYEALTPLTVVIGKNGAGKSSLFDTFGFLSDCLKFGVEEACDRGNRGGFHRILSKNQKGPIEFEIYYKQDAGSRPITYELAIDLDRSGRPYVLRERLRQRRSGQIRGWPFSFLILERGEGFVWKEQLEGVEDYEGFDIKDYLRKNKKESGDKEYVELEDKRRLGIATLGALKQHPRISAFRKFIEGWYLSYFTPDAARSLPLAGPQNRLNIHGDNIGNVVQFMERDNSKKFQNILESIANKIPSINKISTEKTTDGRLLLKFNENGFTDPFYAQQMSDGTLKIFAYLLLLGTPNPPPFVCIEEPENGLYHKLLEILAAEFRIQASGKKDSSQIFVTTHQPYFVDALNPNEVWIMKKDADGFSSVQQASSNLLVKNLVEEEMPLGSLWYSNYLDV